MSRGLLHRGEWKEAEFADELRKIMDVNLLAPLFLARSFARHWLGLPASADSTSGGRGRRDEKPRLNKRVIFISSISGLVNMTPQKQVGYNASKAGLTMASKVGAQWALWQLADSSV